MVFTVNNTRKNFLKTDKKPTKKPTKTDKNRQKPILFFGPLTRPTNTDSEKGLSVYIPGLANARPYFKESRIKKYMQYMQQKNLSTGCSSLFSNQKAAFFKKKNRIKKLKKMKRRFLCFVSDSKWRPKIFFFFRLKSTFVWPTGLFSNFSLEKNVHRPAISNNDDLFHSFFSELWKVFTKKWFLENIFYQILFGKSYLFSSFWIIYKFYEKELIIIKNYYFLLNIIW